MAIDLYGADAGKIRGAYQKHLGRNASDEELGSWLGGQYGGGGVDDWVNQIGQSHEAGIFRQNNPQTPPQQDWLDAQPGVNEPYQPPPTSPGAPPTSNTMPVGGQPNAPVNETQQAVDQIRKAYLEHLGRAASDEEVNNWLAGNYGWGTGAAGVPAMIQGISTSGEAQAYQASKGVTAPPPQAQPAQPPPPTFQPPAPAPVAAPAAPQAAPAAPAPSPAPSAPTAPQAPKDGDQIIDIGDTLMPGDWSPITTPGAPAPIPTLTDDVTKILKERLEQLRQPQDIQGDPTYQQALKAYQIQQLRGADRQRAAMAERMAAEGTLNSGGFNTGVGGILERQAENEAGYAGGLALDRLASREQQLLQAISLARQVGQDDIANQLEQERFKLSQELGRGQLALSQKDQALRDRLGTGDLELRSRLGLSDLELRRLLGMGQLELGRGDLALRGELGRGNLGLGYDQLGQNYAEMIARANREAVLAAL